ncbi:hypothetical protein ACFX13_040409 [Malus domestica]
MLQRCMCNRITLEIKTQTNNISNESWYSFDYQIKRTEDTPVWEVPEGISNNIDRNHGPGSVHEADWSTPNGNKNNAAASGDHINKGNTSSSPRRGVTYKEVLLQKGTNKGGIGKKEENKVNNKEEVESSVADDDSETNSKDDLLELFESAWLMTSPRKNKGKYAPRSVSFIF